MKTRGLGEAARSLLDGRTSGQMKPDGSEGVSFCFLVGDDVSAVCTPAVSAVCSVERPSFFGGFFVPVHLLVSLSGRLSLRPASADRLHGKIYTASPIFFHKALEGPLFSAVHGR